MILSDNDIRASLSDDDPDFRLFIDPFKEENLQPSGYDLTLGNVFLEFKYPGIIHSSNTKEVVDLMRRTEGQFLSLPPGGFFLATTREKVQIPPNLCAQVHGRSSIGRLGVAVHITAGYVDPGFGLMQSGGNEITLEVKNHSDMTIILSAGERVAQLIFMEMMSKPSKIYSGRYQHQRGPVASKLWDVE